VGLTRIRGLERIRNQAWIKVERALVQLDKLRRQDFVYPDGRSALDQIEAQLKKQQAALERLRPDTSADQVASTYASVRSLLGNTVPMLGFILRSTNVRNAFEAYDPLRRLCRQLFRNDQVKLILSSDWDFSPVTLPMDNKRQFPGLIFIGLPATEGDNALLMPLAGHEIAHSLWQVLDIGRVVQKQALRHARDELKKRGFTDERIDADIGEAQNLALRQCEEVFCDLFAVRLFGNAAMAAFGYFFVPGYEKRSRIYPKLNARFDYMVPATRTCWLLSPAPGPARMASGRRLVSRKNKGVPARPASSGPTVANALAASATSAGGAMRPNSSATVKIGTGDVSAHSR